MPVMWCERVTRAVRRWTRKKSAVHQRRTKFISSPKRDWPSKMAAAYWLTSSRPMRSSSFASTFGMNIRKCDESPSVLLARSSRWRILSALEMGMAAARRLSTVRKRKSCVLASSEAPCSLGRARKYSPRETISSMSS
eukprot:551317-Prymnesium_polylepis.2